MTSNLPNHTDADPALDIEQPEALLSYLRRTGRIEPDEQPAVRVLAGGVSNRTVHLARPTGEAWVLKQALAKLRVQVDWFSDPARIQREALGIRHLAELAPGCITPLIFQDPAHHLLAMQAVPEPHENWKTLLLAGTLESDHVSQFARLLGRVHRRAHDRRDALEPVFADAGFFESLRLEPYYGYAAEQTPEARAFLRTLIDTTRRHRHTLVHGDYSPKNVLVHAGRLILLDHEVIHWGDPAFDLGFSLTHLLSKAHHLPGQRDAFATAAAQYWQAYRDALGDVPWGDGLEARAVAHTLGCLLARVAGRSPLEYLSEPARQRQRAVVVALMASPPRTVPGLIEQFTQEL